MNVTTVILNPDGSEQALIQDLLSISPLLIKIHLKFISIEVVPFLCEKRYQSRNVGTRYSRSIGNNVDNCKEQSALKNLWEQAGL